MSINVTEHFVKQYSTNVSLLLQEFGPKLRPYVTSGQHVGKQASPVNQIGAVAMRKVTSRFTPKERTDAPYARRWVFPTDYTLDQQLDSFDQLKMITDPKGPYAQNAMLAAGRAIDDALIEAALGDAKTGEEGNGTEAFDTSNFSVPANFGASADVGLTVKKMIEVNRMFRAANVDIDMDPVTYIISPQQEADLLNQVEVVSTDYNDRPVLVDGRVKRFLGSNIIVSNRLGLVNTDERACIAFVKSGLYLGVWKDIEADAHPRHDLEGDPWELTTKLSIGATRLEQGKVIRVLAAEA